MAPLARRPAAFALLACTLLSLPTTAQRPLPHPLDRSRDWQAAVTAGTHTEDGKPGPQHWTDFASYQIEIELVPGSAEVIGRQRATYHNRSPEPLRELLLHLRQNLYTATAVRNVPVQITAGIAVDRVVVAGQPVDASIDGTRMLVPLPEALAPDGKVELALEFSFVVPEGEAPRMGREGNELFFVGYWYPQFAVRDCVRGWVAEPYLGESEFYMPYADYEVAITLPQGWLCAATGTLQNPAEVLTDASREALAKAATASETVPIVGKRALERGEATQTRDDGKLVWRFQAKNVRDFAFGACPTWRWDASSALVGDRDGDGAPDRCLVQTFYRRPNAAWRPSCKFAQHTIEHLSQWLAPYPWPHATVVEGILGGGMEYPMLTLCGDQRIAFGQQSLIAHELGHMWFPMLVGNDETAFGWQDEGLVDFYTELLESDYWRRDRTKKAPSSMRQYAQYAAQGLDREPMLRHADHLQFRESYGFLSYTKPAAVLQQLARWLGEDKVTAALRDYTQAWRFAHPTPEDFFASMNRSLGQDLDWYWSTWWTTTWTLDHAVGAVTNGEQGATVVIRDEGRAPHPAFVRVRFLDGTTQDAEVPVGTWLAGATTATLTFAKSVVEVTIDPEQRTLDVDRDDNRWAAK